MKIVNREQAKIIITPHGSEIRPLIDRTTTEIEQCSLAEEVLPPGATVGQHLHRQTEEIYYILTGSGEMTVNKETTFVGAGDAVFIPKNSSHTLTNIGTKAMTILLVCGPAHSFNDHYPVK